MWPRQKLSISSQRGNWEIRTFSLRSEVATSPLAYATPVRTLDVCARSRRGGLSSAGSGNAYNSPAQHASRTWPSPRSAIHKPLTRRGASASLRTSPCQHRRRFVSDAVATVAPSPLIATATQRSSSAPRSVVAVPARQSTAPLPMPTTSAPPESEAARRPMWQQTSGTSAREQ